MYFVAIVEYVSAVYLGIALIGQYNMQNKAESSKWLRIAATSMLIYLLIDAVSETTVDRYPFVLGYGINLLSYITGSIVLIFFNKYCEHYIGERTGQKPRAFWLPITLNVLFAAATAILFFCGKLVVYENRIEVAYYDYPIWLRLIQIIAMLVTSAVAISKWKSIGIKAVVLLGLFILAPAFAGLIAIPTGVDTSVAFGAATLTLIMTILQKDRIEEQRTMLSETREIANTDALTHVKNDLAYTAMRNKLNSEIQEQSSLEFALVFCDLNGLKTVNDTYGHEAGDKYIQNGCGIVCEVYDRSPVYRIGGDEFVVVLRGADYQNRKEKFLLLHERIREAEIIESIDAGRASLAAGMAEYQPGKDMDVRDVQGRADAAMYQEKGSKRR